MVVLGTVSAGTSVSNSLLVEGRLQTVATYGNTSAAAANLYIGSSGVLVRSTSSARFKTNVETMEDSYADAILEARPVWYNSTASEDTAHPEWGYWGFIAEEIDLIDPRLVHYGEDANGNLRPDGVQYERFVPHLVNLAKRQKVAIEELGSRIDSIGGNNIDLSVSDLQTKVSVLEAENQKLSGENEKLKEQVKLLEQKMNRVWDRLGL